MKIRRHGDPGFLQDKRIAVLGYGNQGRAQACNMRGAGLQPIVGLWPRSTTRRVARTDGMEVTSPLRAARSSDIVFILTPDETHGSIYVEIEPVLRTGAILVFAHASSVHFGLVKPRSDLNILLLAPLGPGKRLRELCRQRPGVACFFAIHQGPVRRSQQIGLALASAIGCLPAGAIETTFAEEAVGDLFGEQAVLCGGLAELLKAGVETLTDGGLSAEKAYLECVYQIDLIVDLIKAEGLDGMYRRISPVAAHGAVTNGPRIIGSRSKQAMSQLHREITSGRFFEKFMRESSASSLSRLRRTAVPSRFTNAERHVRKALG